ncbi:MAG: hypothetical protein HUK22_02280 [Thermoguttaceae bacterium]|nr:hypothetical protein [Thermoguttaceae bacterium]
MQRDETPEIAGEKPAPQFPLWNALESDWFANRARAAAVESDADALRERRELFAMTNAAGTDAPIFCGAGRYDHYIPLAVKKWAEGVDFNNTKSAEQSVLRALQYFQKAVARLTGFNDVRFALHREDSALAAACALAVETTGRKRILVANSVDPREIQILRAFAEPGGYEVQISPTEGGIAMDVDFAIQLGVFSKSVGAVVVQYPNFYGNLEEIGAIASVARNAGALTILLVDPVALATLRSPASWGVDVAVGGPRFFDVSASGARLDFEFLAVSADLAAKAPGKRVVERSRGGETEFVLTDSSEREIVPTSARGLGSRGDDASRREEVAALTSLAYLAFAAPDDLREAATVSRRAAKYARDELAKAGFEPLHDAPYLREFAVKFDDATALNESLRKWGIFGGRDLGGATLLAFTEKRSREEIDELIFCMKHYRAADKR